MRYKMGKILKESTPILIITILISVISGFVLNGNQQMLQMIPGMIIILPAFLNMGGSMSGVLSSRLSSGLHLGYISPHIRKTKFLTRNLEASYITGFVTFLVLGLMAGALNIALGQSINLYMFTFGILIAGLLTVFILSILSVIFSYYSWSKGIDPDDIVIPILTTVGDFIGIFLLFYIMSMVI